MHDFKNKRVFVVGCGPSLTGFDFDRLKGEKVIAINHAYKLTRHDLHVFYDVNFLAEAKPNGYNPNAHTSHILCGSSCGIAAKPGKVTLFRRANSITKEFRHGLYMGYSSGLAAVNAALIYGASEVYLLGIDCRFLTPAEVREAAKLNGNSRAADALCVGAEPVHHVTQDTVKHAQAGKEQKFTNMVNQFNHFKGYPVYNLSPFSALSLPRKKLDDVIKRSTQATLADAPTDSGKENSGWRGTEKTKFYNKTNDKEGK
jgi:hypothetical protein